jgi:cell division protein ZapA
MGVARVEIFGEKYTLKADAETNHIQRVAQYVDGKFSEVAKSSPTISTSKMAILTSLNIADELIRQEEERESSERLISSKIEELISLVDQYVGATP